MSNENLKSFEEMGKAELRAACKNAGIPYGKLNNDGMRAALYEKYSEDDQTQVTPAEEAAVEEQNETEVIQAAQTAGDAEANKAVVAEPLPVVKAVATAAGRGKTAGMKIEKDRDEQNGIKRPSVGGVCRAIWDTLDASYKNGKLLTAKELRAMAPAQGWNENNVSIEYYQWRKFMGIRGRQG